MYINIRYRNALFGKLFTSKIGVFPVATNPHVTAGLTWPPLMSAVLYTAAATENPKLRAIPTIAAAFNECITELAATAAPVPPNTRIAVPMNSANTALQLEVEPIESPSFPQKLCGCRRRAY